MSGDFCLFVVEGEPHVGIVGVWRDIDTVELDAQNSAARLVGIELATIRYQNGAIPFEKRIATLFRYVKVEDVHFAAAQGGGPIPLEIGVRAGLEEDVEQGGEFASRDKALICAVRCQWRTAVHSDELVELPMIDIADLFDDVIDGSTRANCNDRSPYSAQILSAGIVWETADVLRRVGANVLHRMVARFRLLQCSQWNGQ